METLLWRASALVLLVPASLFFAYSLALGIASLFGRRSEREAKSAQRPWHFGIVIPAHDEEDTIGPTLESCIDLDYPAELRTIFVIADNCTDGTASVVESHGLQCLVREDPIRRGKGFALRWAFDQLLEHGLDAFVVLDADCRLDPHALSVFAEELSRGAEVLQANYVVSNPDSTAMSFALAVGNVIENDLYYLPKSKLGLFVSLRGTGMVFRREVLERLPWNAYSIVEDLDYSMSLYDAGSRVRYLHDVAVHSAFPESLDQLVVQRTRWAGGNIRLGRTSAVKMMGRGLSQGRWLTVDMALTILTQSRPLQLALLGAGLAIAAGGWWRTGDPVAEGLFGLALALILGYAGYIAWGVARLGLSIHRLGLLLRTPAVAARLVWITVRSAVGGEEHWQRTPRV